MTGNLLERVKLYQKCESSLDARSRAIALCLRDPAFFVDAFGWTYHPESDATEQPMVLWAWQAELLRAVLGKEPWAVGPDGRPRKLICDKARKLGLTYVVLFAFVWSWLFEPGVKLGLASRTGADVWDRTEDSLFGKVRFIVQHLPGWMRPGRWDDMFAASPKPALVHPYTGSVILGSRTTLDIFRGGRHKRVFVDEAASVPHLDLVMRSIDEVGPAVLVSTPKGMGNHFARLVHRKTTEAVLEKGSTEAGAVHLRYPYALDPRKDAAWEARKRAELSDEAWAQEYGLDYRVSAPGRIWPAFDRSKHLYDRPTWTRLVAQGWLEGAIYIEAWDFGSGRSLTACPWAAYVPPKGKDFGADGFGDGILYLLDYRQWHSQPVEVVAADVGKAGWNTKANPMGRRPHRRVGDVAGKQRDSKQQSCIDNLAELGIEIDGQSMQYGLIEWAIQMIGKAIRDGRLFCAPDFAVEHTPGLPSGVECIEQYRRGKDSRTLADYTGEDEKPLKDIYSHLADGLQHIAIKIWPRVHEGLVPQDGYTHAALTTPGRPRRR